MRFSNRKLHQSLVCGFLMLAYRFILSSNNDYTIDGTGRLVSKQNSIERSTSSIDRSQVICANWPSTGSIYGLYSLSFCFMSRHVPRPTKRPVLDTSLFMSSTNQARNSHKIISTSFRF